MSSEIKTLKAYLNKPMSNTEIMKRLGGRTKILMYDQLNDYEDIDAVLEPYGNCVILLRTENNFGHWICLKRLCERICFFDSYGEFPDKQKQYVNKKFIVKSNQKYNKLCELLYKASFKYLIEFSQYKLQRMSDDVSTCGQWCCLFIESGMLVDDFKKYIDTFLPKLKDRDLICVKLFYDL